MTAAQPPVFYRSSFCATGACVEVAHDGGRVLLRDSKTGQTLTFTAADWQSFVTGVHAGDFDRH